MSAEIEVHRPRYLYRYRSLKPRAKSTAAEVRNQECAAIFSGILFCSEFYGLNDPMEGQFAAGRSPTWLSTEISSGKGRIGICSFSETHNNELMWAHYADEFRGMCVRYRFGRLVAALPAGMMTRVSYSDTVPRFGQSTTSVDRLTRRALSTKGSKWVYEREWRYLAPCVGKIDYEIGKHPVVDRVYLGFRMDSEVRSEIRGMFRRTQVGVHDMDIEGYTLRFSAADD